MMILLKIAFGNILKNKKRTLLIGLTLTISCTLLLFSFSIGNGIHSQILDKYRDFQSGDVSVVWSNVKNIDSSDPSRLFFSAFDIKRDKENKAAIKRLEGFLNSNSQDIKAIYKSVRGNGMLDTGNLAAYSLIFGLTSDEAQYLTDKKVLQLMDGDLPFKHEYGICISEDTAIKNNIRLGDWVTLDSSTAHGYINTQEYQVVGLYKSSSDFDSIYVYMAREDALELFDQEAEYFQGARIYLKNPSDSKEFASKLDAYLTEGSGVLRAEPMDVSSEFYSMIAGFMKDLFTFFVIFILFIIAIGIRSVIRMNIFERMKEFGTLRAIGFNRFQNFAIVFLEIFIMSLIFFGIAFVLNILLVLLLENTGIYIGEGAVAYALGGESIYPVFIPSDVLSAMAIITLFSVFAPLKPGLRLCCQKITDLLAQNQKPLSAILSTISSIFKHKRKLSKTANSIIGG